jgi:hypothetical protein
VVAVVVVVAGLVTGFVAGLELPSGFDWNWAKPLFTTKLRHTTKMRDSNLFITIIFVSSNLIKKYDFVYTKKYV